MNAYGYGSTKIDFRLSKKDDVVRLMESNKIAKHYFCWAICNVSTIPEEDLNHLTSLGEGGPSLGEGGPLVLLVLGPIEDMPLFLVYLFLWTLKGERSTIKVASWNTSGALPLAGIDFFFLGGWGSKWERPEECWAARRFLKLEVDRMGLAKLLYSRIEKGLV